MIVIWDKFIDKEYTDSNMSIKEAYAIEKNVKVSWVQDSANMTIQGWVDACCDQLEEEGYDLKETSIELVREKFIKYDISIVPPKEFKQLQNALEQANKTLEMLAGFKADETIIDQVKTTIRLLTSEMKELS